MSHIYIYIYIYIYNYAKSVTNAVHALRFSADVFEWGICHQICTGAVYQHDLSLFSKRLEEHFTLFENEDVKKMDASLEIICLK